MNKHYKFVDLTHKLYVNMPSYPNLPPFKIEQIKNLESDGSNVHMITSMHTHLGTHVDFPLHVIPGSKSSDDYALEDLSGEGVIIDLSYKGAGEEITEEDLAVYSDYISNGEILFIFTGWSNKRDNITTYLFEWPHLGKSAAYLLVKKGIKIVGIDTLSIGGWSGKVAIKKSPTKTQSREIHEILLGAGVLVVEELANLDKVLMSKKVARAFFIVVPLAIKGVEASPCRVVSMVSDF